jgi:hypothetical protein
MLSAWPWLFLAALLVLPVILRAVAEEPDNAITHESGEEEKTSSDEEDERPGRDLRLAA